MAIDVRTRRPEARRRAGVGRVRIVPWDDPDAAAAAGRSSLRGGVKDLRYHDVAARTLAHGGCGHFLVEDDEGPPVVQPWFLYDLDLTLGAGRAVRSAAAAARTVLPHFLGARALVLGCVAGEGALAGRGRAEQAWEARSLAAALPAAAEELGARLILLKEFPPRYRSALRCFVDAGFARIPSLPLARLPLPYGDVDEYVAALGRSTRRSLRRNLRAAERRGLALEVKPDVSDCVDELFPLYLDVARRSRLGFERLTPGFLAALGRELPDRVRFFVWRLDGRAVAFSLCLIHGDTLYDEYLGLDYDVALDLHLWFVTFRDLVAWAIEHGLHAYSTTPGAYEPKRRLGCRLAPHDLYVRHTSSVASGLLRAATPLLDPSRHDPELRRFRDYAALR